MNLLFDLGGVIMDIRKENCIAAFERLGLKEASSYFGEFSQQGPFMELERGDMRVEEFHAALKAKLPAGVTDAQIDDAFCQFLIGIPVHRLHSLEQLRRRYPVYMLSNTNPIMWNSKIKTEFEKDGKEREDYFDGIITSFSAHSLKPEAKIFEYAAKTLGIEPSETLFLDDSEANLEAAEELGFKTALVAPGEEFPEVLAEVLPRLNA